MLKKTAYIVIFCLFANCVQAQDNPKKLFKNAVYFLEIGYFEEALDNTKKLYNSDPENPNFNYLLGKCYFNIIPQKYDSEPYLLVASKSVSAKYTNDDFNIKDASPETFLMLGELYHFDNDLDKAEDYYTRYKEIISDKTKLKNANHQLNSISRARRLQQTYIPYAKENLGDKINTIFSDYNPVFSFDGSTMAYTSFQNGEDQIFISRNIRGEWSQPVNISTQINSNGSCFTAAMSHSGNKLYVVKIDEMGSDIFYTEYNGNNWSEIKSFDAKINTAYYETSFYINATEDELYFSSNAPNGFGGQDLYFCTKDENGEWTYPENMGARINTPYDEEYPYLSQGGSIMFFSSKGHETMGGFDIFYASRIREDVWSKPINAGFPINTTSNDLAYVALENGNEGYLVKDLPGGIGNVDIYRVDIPKDLLFADKLTFEEGEYAALVEKSENAIEADSKPITDSIPSTDSTVIDSLSSGQAPANSLAGPQNLSNNPTAKTGTVKGDGTNALGIAPATTTATTAIASNTIAKGTVAAASATSVVPSGNNGKTGGQGKDALTSERENSSGSELGAPIAQSTNTNTNITNVTPEQASNIESVSNKPNGQTSSVENKNNTDITGSTNKTNTPTSDESVRESNENSQVLTNNTENITERLSANPENPAQENLLSDKQDVNNEAGKTRSEGDVYTADESNSAESHKQANNSTGSTIDEPEIETVKNSSSSNTAQSGVKEATAEQPDNSINTENPTDSSKQQTNINTQEAHQSEMTALNNSETGITNNQEIAQSENKSDNYSEFAQNSADTQQTESTSQQQTSDSKTESPTKEDSDLNQSERVATQQVQQNNNSLADNQGEANGDSKGQDTHQSQQSENTSYQNNVFAKTNNNISEQIGATTQNIDSDQIHNIENKAGKNPDIEVLPTGNIKNEQAVIANATGKKAENNKMPLMAPVVSGAPTVTIDGKEVIFAGFVLPEYKNVDQAFTIQTYALKNHKQPDFFKRLGNVKQSNGNDGLARYSVGYFTNYKQAQTELGRIKDLGITDAFIRDVRSISNYFDK